jgi:tetratricopeptide (TPR) repeat protein
LLPWLALSLATGVFTSWVERTSLAAEGRDFEQTFVERGLVAGRAVWFYAAKLVWPVDRAFVYARWQVDSASPWPYAVPAAALAVVAAAWRLRHRSRGPLAALLLFGGTLLPVLGFVNFYGSRFSYVADHWQYLSSLALIPALSALLARLCADRLSRLLRTALAVALLLTLGMLTWREAGAYRDAETLYRTTLARNPECWMCLTNLGVVYANGGRNEAAIELYRQSLRLKPDAAETHNSLGNALIQSALEADERGAVSIRPAVAKQALDHFEEALRLSPKYIEAYNNLAGALFLLGRLDEARADYETALRIRPDYPQARHNLELLKARQAAVAAKP